MTVSVITTEYGYRYLKCECDETEIRRRVQSNGVEIYVIQCLTCGRQIKPISKKSPEVLALGAIRPFDDAIGAHWDRRQRQLADIERQRRQDEEDAKNAEWWRRYNAYLKTPQWQEKRKLVFERAGGMCEGCRRKKATQVHHLTYDHVGNELLFELVAICDACHRRIHPRMS